MAVHLPSFLSGPPSVALEQIERVEVLLKEGGVGRTAVRAEMERGGGMEE